MLVNRPTLRLAFAASVLAWHSVLAQPADPKGTSPADHIVALDPRWTLTIGSDLAAPAGFDRELAYIPLKSGELAAVGLDDGRARWQVRLATPFTPVAGDGLVFVAVERALAALEQKSGHELWRLDLEAPLAAPPHWESGIVFVSTEPGELIAVRAEDGSVVWRNPLSSPLSSPPTASDEHLYVALKDGRVAALALDGGATVWTLPLKETVSGMLALREQLLVGTRANLLHSIANDRGRIRWTQKVGADVMGAPTADEQTIYFVAYDNVLRALSRRTGNLRWTRNLPSRPSGGPVRVLDVILVPMTAELIGAYLATTGAEAFTIRAKGETMGAPYLRDHTPMSLPAVIAQSREGDVQGFAARIEPPLTALGDLPGTKTGG